jgi:hypothetical protein
MAAENEPKGPSPAGTPDHPTMKHDGGVNSAQFSPDGHSVREIPKVERFGSKAPYDFSPLKTSGSPSRSG